MNKVYNYPCKCGHSKVNHAKVPVSFGPLVICQVGYCECENFNPDNLKYLENKYDKRNTTK